MEETKKLMAPLIELGLNKYESRVYLALITEGTATAKDISDITGIPYGKVYEIINLLCAKGFSVILPTKPMRCRAVPPENALENTRKSMHSKLATIQEQVSNYLTPLFEKTKDVPEPKGNFVVLNGRKNILKKIDEIISQSKKQVYILTTEGGVRRVGIHKQHLQDAVGRGVDVKVGGVITDHNKEDLHALQVPSYSLRKVPSQIVIADGTKGIMIDAKPDDDSIVYGRDTALVTTNPSMLKLLTELCKNKLSKAKKFPA